MQKESCKLGALISKFFLGDEMPINTYIHMEGEENIELEFSSGELVDVALGINYAQALILMLTYI